MPGFVNDLAGANDEEVLGWSQHLHSEFPASRASLDHAERAINPDHIPVMRRLAVHGELERLLTQLKPRMAVPPDTRLPSMGPDPVAKAEKELNRISPAAIETHARRLNISVEEARALLAKRLQRNY